LLAKHPVKRSGRPFHLVTKYADKGASGAFSALPEICFHKCSDNFHSEMEILYVKKFLAGVGAGAEMSAEAD
jgi:hypothetical protein